MDVSAFSVAQRSTRPFANERFVVDGVPAQRLACTERACPQTETCCNTCSVIDGCPYEVGNGTGSLCVSHTSFACTAGNSCAAACTPFAVKEAKRYRFIGTVRYDEKSAPPQPRLEVTDYCEVP